MCMRCLEINFPVCFKVNILSSNLGFDQINFMRPIINFKQLLRASVDGQFNCMQLGINNQYYIWDFKI